MAVYLVIAVAVIAVLVLPGLVHKSNTNTLTYQSFLSDIQSKEIKTATVDLATGTITGDLANGGTFTVNGPNPIIDSEINALKPLGSNYHLSPGTSNPLVSILIEWVLPFAIIGGIFFYISRKAQGQMGSIMSIGRSKSEALLDRAALDHLR